MTDKIKVKVYGNGAVNFNINQTLELSVSQYSILTYNVNYFNFSLKQNKKYILQIQLS